MQTQLGRLQNPSFQLLVLTDWVREADGNPSDSELSTPQSFPEMVPAASEAVSSLTLEMCKIELDLTGQEGGEGLLALGGMLGLSPLWTCTWLGF